MILSLQVRLDNLDWYSNEIWNLTNRAYASGSPWTKEQFIDDMKNKHSIYCVIYEKETIVGIVSGHHVLDETEIHHVVVLPSMQGKGYGTLLLREFLSFITEDNQIAAIFLEVRKSNVKAQNLYKKCGFVTIACRKKYYKHPLEDAQIMTYKTAKTCYE